MNKSRLIGGIICLAIAALLAVLNLTLPADNMMFTVGDRNMPWVPVVILGIVGIWLLATAGRGAQRAAQPAQPVVINEEKAALNKRLETIGWGCFLIMFGGFMFVPESLIASGWWSIGVGIIMLGLNVARYFYKIKMSGFTTFLGIVSLVGGVLQLLGMDSLEGAILIIILGAYLLVKPWFDRRQVFGKAETD
ncbi:MAG TPA: hypothetical protein VM537_08425 [Anaerolineae bacterium]|nr:hypothetical protein [Anaerolineae bacterium]